MHKEDPARPDKSPMVEIVCAILPVTIAVRYAVRYKPFESSSHEGRDSIARRFINR